MPKKFSEGQKEEMIDSFINGKTIEQLSDLFKFSKITIIRNLKKNIGESSYQKLLKKNNKSKENNSYIFKEKEKEKEIEYKDDIKDLQSRNESSFPSNQFIEITPLGAEDFDAPRKDFASLPIDEMDFPKVVYMIVDKKIELDIKLLKDFPEWQFLPKDDLCRKTIEIFFDLNLAKRSCNKEQKVLKVPNTDVFRIASPVLIAKGISRIVCAENLIAL